jgi:hypothetical protein
LCGFGESKKRKAFDNLHMWAGLTFQKKLFFTYPTWKPLPSQKRSGISPN